MEILIITNGFKQTWSAIEYGAWLGKLMQMRVTLLGVNEKLNPAQIDDHHPLEDVFGRAVELFQQNGLEYKLEVQNGDAEEVAPRKAAEGDFITIISPLGRPQIRRWLLGRSLRHLMEQIRTPILYAPQTLLPIRNILICMGGLGYEITAENLAVRVAKLSQARVELLHVIPPLDLDYPTAREVQKNSEKLAETDTLLGKTLRSGLERAQRAGLNAGLKVRKGHIVEEILTEVKEGKYDLVCTGSPYSTRALRQLYAPNIAAEVAEAIACPTLVARRKLEENG